MEILVCIALLVCMLLWPEKIMSGAADGVALCLTSVIPSLFPMLTVTCMVTQLAGAMSPPRWLRVLAKLFHLPPDSLSAFPAGLLGGFPAGVTAAGTLYRTGKLTKAQAEALTGFLSCASPAFFLGLLASVTGRRTALLLWSIHLASALLTGILLRPPKVPPSEEAVCPSERPALSAVFASSIRTSVGSMTSVCAGVVFFTALSGLSPTLPGWGGILLRGAMEITGVMEDAARLASPAGPVLVSALCAWGGISVHGQNISILRKADLGAGSYLLGKCVHTLLAALGTAAAMPLLSKADTVRASIPGFSGSVPVAAWTIAGIFLILLLIFVLIFAKNSGFFRRKRV